MYPVFSRILFKILFVNSLSSFTLDKILSGFSKVFIFILALYPGFSDNSFNASWLYSSKCGTSIKGAEDDLAKLAVVTASSTSQIFECCLLK